MHRDAFAIPPAPLALTVAGLIPFYGAAGAMALLRDNPIAMANASLVLVAYTAVILSFLGGARWGAEMMTEVFTGPRWRVLVLSVAGSLIGWGLVIAKVIGPIWPEIHLVGAAALAAHWAWDVAEGRSLPRWYGGLRSLATAGAVLALLIGWAAARFLA